MLRTHRWFVVGGADGEPTSLARRVPSVGVARQASQEGALAFLWQREIAEKTPAAGPGRDRLRGPHTRAAGPAQTPEQLVPVGAAPSSGHPPLGRGGVVLLERPLALAAPLPGAGPATACRPCVPGRHDLVPTGGQDLLHRGDGFGASVLI